jgi:hypothetical protein
MNTRQLDNIAWQDNPFTWRNNRGAMRTKNGYITFGIPAPPHGRKRDDLKGGDRIGWTPIVITPEMVGRMLAVFTSVEIKGPHDTLKPGQKKWHNLVLKHGGISKIYKSGEVIDHEIK